MNDDNPTVLAPVNRGLRSDAEVAAALEPWLRRHIAGATDLRITKLDRPAGSGVANETILIDAIDRSGPRQLVVRVESPDYWYPEREISIHYQLYQVFEGQSLVPTPHVFGLEEDRAVLGERFFVMERKPGITVPDVPSYNSEGWLSRADAGRRHRIWARAVAMMAAFHRASAAFGPPPFFFLDRPERGESGLEQSMRYWRLYYDWAAEARAHPVMEAGWQWLLSNLPADRTTALAWGDARLGNLLFEHDRITGLLDWDMVSLAGAETDLSWWLLMDQAHSRGNGVRRLDGLGNARETIALWEEGIGRSVQDLDFHLAFAAFRLGAVLIKLSNFLANRGLSSPERDRMRTDNFGTQVLATMLGLPTPAPPVIEWRHLRE